MSIVNLAHLFEPGAIAVIGASDRPLSIGNVVMGNLLAGRFPGPIMPVNPKRRAVGGVLAYPDIESLPETPDLAVLCTPAAAVPDLLDRLGRRGVKAAVVTALGNARRELLAAARPHRLRVLGAGSLGVMVPKAHLNASSAHIPALSGRIAFVSQSGALSAAVLDWARPRGIGFSHFVSMGNGADIDFGDLLDYLANESDARAILLHIETLTERRDFMPAMRAAARNKPLVVMKAGRHLPPTPVGPFLAESLAAPDDVFDAAIRRAGALRVDTIDELFAAVETLARARPMRGDRLAVLSNGRGTAMLVMDELNAGETATLTEATLGRLAPILPPGSTPANPVDIGMDAPGRRYAAALGVLVGAPEVDATLIVHAPSPLADSAEVARAIVEAKRSHGGALLTCWIGGESAEPARRLFAEVDVPTYDSFGDAVRGFRHLVNYRRNQTMLLETPPSELAELNPDRATARRVIERGLTAPGGTLSDPEVRELLAAYGLPVLPSTLAATPGEAAAVAERIGFPIALTAATGDVARKWDVGGVALNLESAEAVRSAAEGILRRFGALRPDARFEGFALQRMALRPHAHHLTIGVACDPLFGPVLVFGEGGRAMELPRDHVVALPPINLPLAHQTVARSHLSPLLDAHGLRPAADRKAIAEALVRLSLMVVDNPEIEACDVNPLFADDQGVLAVDARVRVSPVGSSDRRRLSILPYPARLAETVRLHDGSDILLRPIRPEDETAHGELIGRMTPQELRYRFFGTVRKLDHTQLARLTQIDYDREMAFIATRPVAGGRAETLGEVRTATDPDNSSAEFAIIVRSDIKGTGLGSILMNRIIRYHQDRGTGEIGAHVLSENAAMLRLSDKCGFTLEPGEDSGVVHCVRRLGKAASKSLTQP